MQVHQQVSEYSDAIDLMVNMGPQHPSTHGVFSLVIWVDGERIVKVEPLVETSLPRVIIIREPSIKVASRSGSAIEICLPQR